MTPLPLHRRPLERFFSPASIAVIGATETDPSVGRTILTNLASFHGQAVTGKSEGSPDPGSERLSFHQRNSRSGGSGDRRSPRGNRARHCGRMCGSQGPSGDRHIGGLQGNRGQGRRPGAQDSSGAWIDAHHRAELPRRYGAAGRSQCDFRRYPARPGSVGFISQSGALCTAILDWSLRGMVGFSAFVSIGSMLDIGWADNRLPG